jgi:PAS domain-containing protein
LRDVPRRHADSRRPDALQRAAAATGLVRADVQRRLAGILPRVVLVDADRDEIQIAQRALEAAGFPAIAFDPSLAPTDEDRRFARTLDLERDAMVVVWAWVPRPASGSRSKRSRWCSARAPLVDRQPPGHDARTQARARHRHPHRPASR